MRHRIFQILPTTVAAIFLLGALSGCIHAAEDEPPAEEPPSEKTPLNTASIDNVEGLASYGAWLRSIRSQTLEQEYAEAMAALENDPTAANRLRLALLLTLPGAPFQDPARASDYFDQIINEPEEAARSYRGLARFMKAVLEERRQLETLLAEERRQRQALLQKLEQLKAIEQDTGARIPPKPMKEN